MDSQGEGILKALIAILEYTEAYVMLRCQLFESRQGGSMQIRSSDELHFLEAERQGRREQLIWRERVEIWHMK